LSIFYPNKHWWLVALFLISHLTSIPAFATQKITPLASVSDDSTLSYNNELDGFEYPFKVTTYSFTSQHQLLNMGYMDVGDRYSTNVIVLLLRTSDRTPYWLD
jgi:hypothetical protein